MYFSLAMILVAAAPTIRTWSEAARVVECFLAAGIDLGREVASVASLSSSIDAATLTALGASVSATCFSPSRHAELSL